MKVKMTVLELFNLLGFGSPYVMRKLKHHVDQNRLEKITRSLEMGQMEVCVNEEILYNSCISIHWTFHVRRAIRIRDSNGGSGGVGVGH